VKLARYRLALTRKDDQNASGTGENRLALMREGDAATTYTVTRLCTAKGGEEPLPKTRRRKCRASVLFPPHCLYLMPRLFIIVEHAMFVLNCPKMNLIHVG